MREIYFEGDKPRILLVSSLRTAPIEEAFSEWLMDSSSESFWDKHYFRIKGSMFATIVFECLKDAS